MGSSGCPIVAMTANAMQGDRELCVNAGMVDFLAKPYRRDDLIAILARWLPAPITSSDKPAVLTAPPAKAEDEKTISAVLDASVLVALASQHSGGNALLVRAQISRHWSAIAAISLKPRSSPVSAVGSWTGRLARRSVRISYSRYSTATPSPPNRPSRTSSRAFTRTKDSVCRMQSQRPSRNVSTWNGTRHYRAAWHRGSHRIPDPARATHRSVQSQPFPRATWRKHRPVSESRQHRDAAHRS